MIKICNRVGKIICFADPETGLIERKVGRETERIKLSPGLSFYYESDGYVTIIEYEEPNKMYHRSYKI